LPDVEEVLPEATGCRLSVGEPLGVNVASVTSDGAASGILQEGDIISSIGGVATPTRPELTEALAEYSPDDTVEIEFTRDGTASTASITLGAHPDDETRAMIGITVQTAFEQVEPDSADDVVGPSTTARPIQIGEGLFLFDPLDITWQSTGITPPTETRWVSTSSGIYSVTDTDPVAVLDLVSGEAIEDDGFRGWVPQRLIGAVGDIVVLVVTTPAQDQPGFVNLAIAGFDPASGETLWVSPISSASGIPVAAYGSPDESAFLVVGADPESGAIAWRSTTPGGPCATRQDSAIWATPSAGSTCGRWLTAHRKRSSPSSTSSTGPPTPTTYPRTSLARSLHRLGTAGTSSPSAGATYCFRI
jgi:hypothetical protein